VTSQQQILDFYTRPGVMTATGECEQAFEELPRGVSKLAGVVQGVLLHEHLAGPVYGVALSGERRLESHIRSTERMLAGVFDHDSAPLAEARPVDRRLVGTCRNFTVLLVAMLRAEGVPARARCGFGAYFLPGRFVDHWVGEYWNAEQAGWVRVDAQLDGAQRELLKVDFDVLDVPEDRFLIAGDAWAQCRTGEADPEAFGMHDMHGLWFIAGNLVRDVASLNNMEMLPWDVWGAMPAPDQALSDEQLAFFDRLAALTHAPDTSFDELRALYQGAQGLQVPDTVFNAVLNRPEIVSA
jgi:hypothetical protein